MSSDEVMDVCKAKHTVGRTHKAELLVALLPSWPGFWEAFLLQTRM